jgi:sRNA-binding protein
MSCTNDEAGAPEFAGSAGPKAEASEGLINTRPGPGLTTLLRTVAELLPVFTPDPWEAHKPLAIGIEKALIATGILKPWEVRLALRAYCRRRMYVAAVAAAGARYDITGNVAGEVSEQHQACAKASLAHMDAKRAEAAAKVRAEQKAAWLAEKAKRAATAAAGKPKGPRPSAAAPQPATSGDQPRRLGLADLKAAAAARKAAQIGAP